MLVRSPAGFRRYSRSRPTTAQRPAASIRRHTRSTGIRTDPNRFTYGNRHARRDARRLARLEAREHHLVAQPFGAADAGKAKALRYTPAQTSLARTLRQRSERFDAAPLANLLTPHRVVQPLLIDQLVVPTRFYDAAALADVDA